MNKILSEQVHAVTGLDPVADAFDGTVYSDIIRVSNAFGISFLLWKGVGATGTSTVTVQACDDVSATNTSALAFKYRANTATGTSDVWGALTTATSAGFDTTAGSGQMYWIHVDADLLANSGYKFCRLKCVEVVNSPVLGGIMCFLWPLGMNRAIQTTQIA